MLPAAVVTVGIVRQSIFENSVRKFIKTELTQRGTQIISNDVEEDSLKLRVVAVGREITETTRAEAERRMEQYGMKGFRLQIIQGAQTDSVLALNNRLSQISTTREADHQKLLEMSAENAMLRQQLEGYTRLETLTADLRPELTALFPQVTSLGLARMTMSVTDSAKQQSFVTALIGTSNNHRMAHDDYQRLSEWLKVRLQVDSLVVMEK